MILGTTYELMVTSTQIVRKGKDDAGRQRFGRRIRNYCVVNVIFGLLLCVFQVLTFMINEWFKDEFSATLVNIGFDLSCLGVSYE